MDGRFDQSLAVLEEHLGIEFTNRALLLQAITHRSYLNEHRQHPTSHNEVLEFLGDAVLELIVTEHLVRALPGHQEGTLTSLRAAIVNGESLTKIGENLGLEHLVLLSRGQAAEMGKARKYIVACVVEALMGAIYLDQGIGACRMFTDMHILSCVPKLIAEAEDSKSVLQEAVQSQLHLTPTYKVLGEVGPDHNRQFCVGVYFQGLQIAEGVGTSKKEAEKGAAQAALATRNTWERRFLERGPGATRCKKRRSDKEG